MKLRLLVFALLFLAALPLLAELPANAAFHDESIDLTFPPKLSDLDFAGKETYPLPELGYSIRYVLSNLVKLDIYAYDKGLPNISDGVSSAVVIDEFSQTVNALQALEDMGKIKNLKKLDEGIRELKGKSGTNTFLWARHTHEQCREDGVVSSDPRVSETYLTGFRNKFLKLRITYKQATPDGERLTKEAIEAFGLLLSDSTPDKTANKDEPQLAIVLDDSLKNGDPRIIAAWIAYASALSDWAETNPEQIKDNSHKKTFEEEVAAREMLVDTWQEMRVEEPGTGDTYLDELTQVKNSGFMREYVRKFLTQDDWKSPGKLRAKEFHSWSKKNIPDHQVQTLANFQIVVSR